MSDEIDVDRIVRLVVILLAGAAAICGLMAVIFVYLYFWEGNPLSITGEPLHARTIHDAFGLGILALILTMGAVWIGVQRRRHRAAGDGSVLTTGI